MHKRCQINKQLYIIQTTEGEFTQILETTNLKNNC